MLVDNVCLGMWNDVKAVVLVDNVCLGMWNDVKAVVLVDMCALVCGMT